MPLAKIDLVPTPLGLQPTEYIKVSWAHRAHGGIEAITVASIHDGQFIAFRLQWEDPTEDLGEAEGFPDGAVVALPVRGEPALILMGAEDAPIHGLHWSAGNDQLRSVLATGIGSSRPGPDIACHAQATWRDGTWQVTILRDLGAPEGGATLTPGQSARVGFAVWEGGNQERAGIKSFTADWTALSLDA